ncbi:MAG: MBL fold metallo-hydrolase [Proteobacteria bacterium]|nr:MBL fold metallo-hydrolase [Pseudomonadota bacterium]
MSYHIPMLSPLRIGPGIYVVAGPDLTDGRDALAYLIEDAGELALVDAGAGPSYTRILDLIRAAGYDPSALRFIVATHNHIDHIGSLASFVRDFDPIIVAHGLDATAIESADPVRTAARWYGIELAPVKVAMKLEGRIHRLVLGDSELVCLHAPGHTPGSLVVYLDREGRRYLFGQDIHGPFEAMFDSDLDAWRASMRILIDLKADVLCEGHYGVYHGADRVAEFIQGFLDRQSG